jgi:hypothetical protein
MATNTKRSRAFSGSAESRVIASINRIAAKLYKMAKPEYSSAELLQTFIHPDDHHALTRTYELTRGLARTQTLSVDLKPWRRNEFDVEGTLHFDWTYDHDPQAFIAPIDNFAGPCPTCPDFLSHKFQTTLNAMLTIGYEWGLVRHVFDQLNKPDFCSTPQQMRFVWPSILELLRQYDPDSHMVKLLREESTRAGDRARVPPEIAPFMRSTYDTVTKSIFLVEQEPQDRMGTRITYHLRQLYFTTPAGMRFSGA